jgi:glutaredoxin
MEIRFYTREGCPLCKKAETLIEDLAFEFGITVFKVDIVKDAEAFEKYWDMIPVVELPNGMLLWGRIERTELEIALQSS